MKTKNKRNLINIILSIILLIASSYVYIAKGYEIKYLISIILAFGLVAINIFLATKNVGFKNISFENADERDLYIAMKSAQSTLKFINDICLVFVFSFLILYGVTNNFIFMVMGLTLFALIVIMFITLLITQSYYEKNY
ncbi:hypothetical protein V7D15_10990 [Thermoanaerobacter thermohydrosulfuricus]|nr:hypothetical protein [Clostridia bacterium]